MEKKITKDTIEKIAKEIRKWVRDNRLGSDYSMLYNGKYWYHDYQGHFEIVVDKYGLPHEKWISKKKIKTNYNVDPHQFCEWFPEKFILGLCVDGAIYRCLNGYEKPEAKEKLDAILQNYGLYLECCDYCYWSVEVGSIDIEEVEYTYWHKESIIWLYDSERADDGIPLSELATIMNKWYELSKATGDKGCCTIGEYMEFRYRGTLYRMCPQSPYQGDYSWSCHVPEIKKMLVDIGATEIYMNYGRMD